MNNPLITERWKFVRNDVTFDVLVMNASTTMSIVSWDEGASDELKDISQELYPYVIAVNNHEVILSIKSIMNIPHFLKDIAKGGEVTKLVPEQTTTA